jgi:hypothetical protein
MIYFTHQFIGLQILELFKRISRPSIFNYFLAACHTPWFDSRKTFLFSLFLAFMSLLFFVLFSIVSRLDLKEYKIQEGGENIHTHYITLHIQPFSLQV